MTAPKTVQLTGVSPGGVDCGRDDRTEELLRAVHHYTDRQSIALFFSVAMRARVLVEK